MKHYLPLIMLFILSGLALPGQVMNHRCATVPGQAWADQLTDLVASLKPVNVQKSPPIRIPYQIHLIKASDGTSQISLQLVYKEIDTLNINFGSANIVFYECEPPEIILSDSLFYYDHSEESVLLSQHHTPNVVNLYIPDMITYSGSGLAGYSYYPPSPDIVVMSASAFQMTNRGTMTHELGHYFGLMHTHESYPYGDELVNGSNCATAGDRLCDTPADPILNYMIVDSSCVYTGTATDANGMAYAPDVHNFMSYSLGTCYTSFSPLQYSLMNTTATTKRSNLACSSGVGLKEHDRSLFSVFPNPGNESLSVSPEQGAEESTFGLYDVYGKRVLSTTGSGTYRIDTRQLPSGIYFYVLDVSGNSYSGKWMKE